MELVIDFGIVATIIAGGLSLISTWTLFAIKMLTNTLKDLSKDIQAITVINTTYGVKIDMFVETIRDIRGKQELLSSKIESISLAVERNTVLTQKAVERADAAFKEANTVNHKIAEIGLQVTGGREKLEDGVKK
jgi:uncharacterized coiled-coil DUF342 family protein